MLFFKLGNIYDYIKFENYQFRLVYEHIIYVKKTFHYKFLNADHCHETTCFTQLTQVQREQEAKFDKNGL